MIKASASTPLPAGFGMRRSSFRRRRISFNVTELCKVAVKATGSKLCFDLTKLPEGNFNKVFLMVMNNGKEIIAKPPNPNAVRPHFTTASEVVIMDFVRVQLLLGLPLSSNQ
jgi:hypothetical protein